MLQDMTVVKLMGSSEAELKRLLRICRRHTDWCRTELWGRGLGGFCLGCEKNHISYCNYIYQCVKL